MFLWQFCKSQYANFVDTKTESTGLTEKQRGLIFTQQLSLKCDA